MQDTTKNGKSMYENDFFFITTKIIKEPIYKYDYPAIVYFNLE